MRFESPQEITNLNSPALRPQNHQFKNSGLITITLFNKYINIKLIWVKNMTIPYGLRIFEMIESLTHSLLQKYKGGSL